jgi:competence protein ComEA
MQFSRRQIIAYVAVAAVVAAVGVRYLVLPGAADPGGGEPLILSSVAPVHASPAAGQGGAAGGQSSAATASPAADAVVYVCGAVRSPGVVRLPQGARVADALELAGGATARAELAAVNLAARVVDGQQILVPEKTAANGQSGGGAGPSAAAAAAATAAGAAVPGAPVNINTASLTELDTLQGVGPSTAQKIIDYRTANGPFARIEDIMNVSGIGEARFAALKDSITV